MARTSRHMKQLVQTGRVIEDTAPASIEAPNRTAIYVRLSLCDNLYHQNEESIESQLQLLRDYISYRPDLYLAAEYIDRGWTGMNFQRPGLLQMVEDMQAGKINCVLVKDLSRIGRNYWETGYFLEVLLPQLHVRFISVADRFDSLTDDAGSLAIILKNILNDFYSRDLSRRFSDSYDLRKASGVFRRGQPYGYIYDPDHPCHLTFDSELSYYVRLIFQWALEKVSCAAIAQRLQAMKAPTPGPISTRYVPAGEGWNRRWRYSTVETLISNRVYAGDFVLGKSYKRKCDPCNYRPHIPEEEWIILPDSHPGYVTHEEFETLQNHRKSVADRHWQVFIDSADARKQNPNIYRGKVVCPLCGRIMCASIQQRGKELRYLCQNMSNAQEQPHFLNVKKSLLDILVLNQLHGQIYLAHQLAAWLRSPMGKKTVQLRFQEARDRFNQATEQQAQLKAERSALFERYADRLLSKKRYVEAMGAIREKLRQTSEQMESASQALAAMTTGTSRANPWLRLFTGISYPEAMTVEIVQQTIDRILIKKEEDAEVIFLHQENFKILWDIYQQAQS